MKSSKIGDWFGIFPDWDDIPSAQRFPKTILTIIRRVMPTIIANELIGVQPMTGPTSSVFALRARYAESKKDDD